ncbi:MAG: glycosyltransferase family 4 protein [Rhizobacter sp.]|nr:glycosyltransferase family 4 protein [Chlorobiales bacterium]
MKRIRVALISQDLRQGGGVAALNRFVYKYLTSPEHAAKGIVFDPKVIAYAPFKYHPDLSVSVLNLFNHGRGVGEATVNTDGVPQVLIGAVFPELEINRYRPNTVWKQVLGEFDIHHFITGVAMLGYPLVSEKNTVQKKYVAWVASTLRDERAGMLARLTPPQRVYEDAIVRRCEILEREVLTHASHLCSLSPYTQTILHRRYPELSSPGGVPQSVMTSPVDTHLYRPLQETDKKSADSGYLLMVGRINDERKNVPLLLEAYTIAKSTLKSLPKLKLAGDTPKPALVEQRKRLNLENDVEFCGAVGAEALPVLYRNASLFILPSLQEGLGIVLLEAMASGVPVISTRSGGPEIIISDGTDGLFAENNNPYDLAEKILDMMTNAGFRRRLGEAARRKAVQKFSVEAIGGDVISIYRKVYPELF